MLSSPSPTSDPSSTLAQRQASDRRQAPTRWWAALHHGGRRLRLRRTAEHRTHYYVDRFPSVTFLFIVLLLVFTIVDGVMTLYLLGADCEEANPVMAWLLSRGMGTFLLGKYILTVVGLPVLLVFKNFYMFGTRFRVGYLIPVFVVLYAALLGYQYCLLRMLFHL